MRCRRTRDCLGPARTRSYRGFPRSPSAFFRYLLRSIPWRLPRTLHGALFHAGTACVWCSLCLFHGSPIASLRVCLVPPRARSSSPCWLRSCSLFSIPRVFRLSHSWPWIFSWRHSVANGGQVSTLSIRYVCSQLSGCGAVSVAQYCCLPNFGRCGRSSLAFRTGCSQSVVMHTYT